MRLLLGLGLLLAALGRLGDPGHFDVWIGVVMQWLGQVIAITAAVLALRAPHRHAPGRRGAG